MPVTLNFIFLDCQFLKNCMGMEKDICSSENCKAVETLNHLFGNVSTLRPLSHGKKIMPMR